MLPPPPPPPLPPPTLPGLPYDLLRLLTTQLPTAACLAALARTCRALHAFASLEGWRVFVRTRFKAFPAATGTPEQWRAWAREQTAVERNSRRRGFVASVLEVRLSSGGGGGGGGGGGWRRGGRGGGAGGRGEGKWAPKGRQTLGYVPVLDLGEAYGGGGVGEEEALVVGAGPDIVVRRRQRRGAVQWWGFGDRDERAGRDDVTALRRLAGNGGAETAAVVVGRANGRLEVVALDTEGRAPGGVGPAEVLASCETGGRHVKDVAVLGGSGEASELVCAVLGSSNVSLYRPLLHQPEAAAASGPVEAVSSIALADVGGGIPWKTAFLSPALVAVGTTGERPLSVLALAREGLRSEPVRVFSAGAAPFGVYALAPLAGGGGNVLLAGWYDGVSRLHDLRAPAPAVAEYRDPIDAHTPIYALHPLGHTRFLAAAARHCVLKIFDLRMPTPTTPTATATAAPTGWATYLAPPAPAPAPAHRGMGAGRGAAESPLYSLAVAAGGARVYAGAQGRVWELDFLGGGGGGGGGGGVGGQRRDAGTRVAMYEFCQRAAVYRQGPEADMGTAGMEGGRLDGRWRAV